MTVWNRLRWRAGFGASNPVRLICGLAVLAKHLDHSRTPDQKIKDVSTIIACAEGALDGIDSPIHCPRMRLIQLLFFLSERGHFSLLIS